MCNSTNNQQGLGWYGDGKHYGWDVAFDCPLHGLVEDDASV